MKLQYTFTRQFFLSGDAAPEPPPRARLPPDPPARGIAPPDPAEGVTPLYTPLRGRVYILLGCKVFMGYKHDSKQRPLNQEDNQAPQPTSCKLLEGKPTTMEILRQISNQVVDGYIQGFTHCTIYLRVMDKEAM
jgi:hypothetical protein